MHQNVTAFRRLCSAAATVIVSSCVALSVAPQASAATVSVVSTCDGEDLTVYGSPGDTIEITMGAGCLSFADVNTALSSGLGDEFSFLRLIAVDGREEAAVGLGGVQWGVLRALLPTTFTVLLLAENANGDQLQPGALLAVGDEASPHYNIIYGGSAASQTGASKNLTVWHRSYARASSDEKCIAGWHPSWARWPNGGTGGWVCINDLYAYHPNETVK